jgi:Ca-activated chloride channel family protein
MRFEHPQLLWLLLPALPGLAAFFWWAWRKKRHLISQFVQSRLLAHLTVGVSARRQKLRMSLMVAAVALLILVLARPQWGFEWEEARQRGLDIVIAIDTSRSMLAGDLPPNRLERAKLASLDLLKLARTDRLGLVAFAGAAFLQCPLTIDNTAFRQSLNGLTTSIIPQGGTALAEAIRAAQGAFADQDENYKVLILFTDGEDHDGHALEAARQAAKEGLRIYTIGVGTPNGELITLPNANGGTDFLKDDQGQVVKSRLDDKLLQEIAEAGGGFYQALSGANTMDILYERGLAPLPKSEFSARQVKRYHEHFQAFLGVALVLLLAEMFIPEQKRVPRASGPGATPGDALGELRRSVASPGHASDPTATARMA